MGEQVPPPRHKFRRNVKSYLDNSNSDNIDNNITSTSCPFRKPSLTSLQTPEFGSNSNIDSKDDRVDMSSVIDNFNRKSIIEQSTSNSQVHSNSSNRISSSRVHITSSSSMKSDLSEMKSSISEMKHLSSSTCTNTTSSKNYSSRLRNSCSLENILINNRDESENCQPIISFPDSDTSSIMSTSDLTSPSVVANTDTMKFEQKRISSALKTKVITDSYSSEKETANSTEAKRIQSGEISFRENSTAASLRSRLDIDGLTAEKSQLIKQEQRSLISGDLSQQEIQNLAGKKMKVQTDSFSSEKMYSAQSNISFSTKTSMSSKSILSSSSASQINGNIIRQVSDDENYLLNQNFDDLENLNSTSNPQEIKCAIQKYSNKLDYFIRNIYNGTNRDSKSSTSNILNYISNIFQRAWAVPTYGQDLGSSLCDTLRTSGGLDLLISNCTNGDREMQFVSARVLSQCLTTENRDYVVKNGLDKVVNAVCVFTGYKNPVSHSRIGTGILEHLFKHSEETCSDVVKLGGLDTVLYECRENDVQVLRNCAGALANLSLYGGGDNHEAMIKRKVPIWLFPLAFHNDDNVKYYACLAITVLVANIEIEAAVLKSGTLELVESFVTNHSPFDFAKFSTTNSRGQSRNWLKRLVPVLNSKREEARNLAAFHFCMEAGIKKENSDLEVFREIGAIDALKQVASSPNAVASKFAAQALRLIGEEVPHQLSQQVPVWSIDDVREWVKQIGFVEYVNNFVESRVDGDLLLQLTEQDLKNDIGLTNGIKRRRFTRELQNLKKLADYTSKDQESINVFLQQICTEFSIYTYNMINAGVDRDTLKNLTEDQLQNECGITNSIHRLKIMEYINLFDETIGTNNDEITDKNLDVFVSYRRSNGSQLASLLKVHLQIRGFTVFLDVERLEAGKFDNNLLQSIKQAKHFLLVLTPQALERCVNDQDCKDWVHREIVAALQCQCNIIPIIDNFQWPEPELLPEDMRSVCHFNGVRWIHDYQDACVDKLERFMRGELNSRIEMMFNRNSKNTGDMTPTTPQIITVNGTNRQNSLNNNYAKLSYNSDLLNGASYTNNKDIVSTKD